jgi:hypothetical protein
MRPYNSKHQAGAPQSAAALFAVCGSNLSPLFHRMLVGNAGWSVEPGDGVRGIPHPGAIRFDLPAPRSAYTPRSNQQRGAFPHRSAH